MPTEFDGEDTFFGFVRGLENELGYFSLSELQGIKGPFGLAIGGTSTLENTRWLKSWRGNYKKEVKPMPYTVTRQLQWPEGTPVVEISSGGIDYTNPDALAEKYQGEFEPYDDPREAATAAIAICKAWRSDGGKKAKVGHGATGGMTMPFDTCTFKELLAWAEKVFQGLPKCDHCGEVLPERLHAP